MQALSSLVGCLLTFWLNVSILRADKPPNILFLLIDDLGWNDIGFNGASDAYTPFLDQLATEESLILHNSYTQHICSPTRAALLTGRYPMRLGLQHKVIRPAATYGVPFSINHTTPNGTVSELEIRLLPQLLKDHGYRTHLVGKWHLGICQTRLLPNSRGFDTHYGLLLGDGDHYFHNKSYEGMNGFDLRNNSDPAYAVGKYSSYLFGNATKDLLLDYGLYDRNVPFFIELAFQVVHAPNEAPETFQEVYNNNTALQNDTDRLDRIAMSTAVDSIISQLIDVLKTQTDLWDDTLVIVQSDNGGPVPYSASNYPLRGSKGSLYEGAVRSATFVTGGVLNDNRRGHTANQMMHVVDWLPTLMEMAGVDTEADEYLSTMDGVSQWDMIQNDGPAVRNQILHNIDPVNCTALNNICGGLRQDNWKLVIGNEVIAYRKELVGWTSLSDINESDMNPTIDCGGPPPRYIPSPMDCPWNGKGCLFDLSNDPCEYYDVSAEYPEVYESMMRQLLIFNATQMLPLQLTHPFDFDGADPANFDPPFWGPWLDGQGD